MLELTSLLDLNGFKCEKLMNKHKSVQKLFNKIKDRKSNFMEKNLLFGCCLDELLAKDQNRLNWEFKIPIILKIVSTFKVVI